MSIDVMKQALEALEEIADEVFSPYDNKLDDAITALRAAIEQGQDKHEDWCASLTQLLMSMPPKPAPCNCKLKTARRDSRQWQGLTDEEIHEIVGKKWWDWEDAFDIEGFSRAIEAKLKEKNA